MDYSNHRAFYRPETAFNKIVDGVFLRYQPLHELSEGTLRRWQDRSFEVFKGLVDDKRVLGKVVEDTSWALLEKPPENVWYGEAKFNGRERPQVVVYRDSITTRLPTKLLFDLAGQSGTDHLFGHLCAFYAGKNDYGEEVACRYQFLAARERGRVTWNSVAGLVAVLHSLHKNIPLKNYSKALLSKKER